MKLSKQHNKIFESTILLLILFLSLILWDTIIIYPIKLFVILLHEISHGIAAIISGGKINEINIDLNLGGKCITEGGNPFLIASSGYLGSFLFGSIIFYSTYKKNLSVYVVTFIAVVIFLFAVNTINNFVVSLIPILFSVLLFIIIKFTPQQFSNYILRSIGLISCLYVIFDIKEDILSHTYFYSDASTAAELSGIPAFAWGLIWLSISLVGIILLMKKAYKKY